MDVMLEIMRLNVDIFSLFSVFSFQKMTFSKVLYSGVIISSFFSFNPSFFKVATCIVLFQYP